MATKKKEETAEVSAPKRGRASAKKSEDIMMLDVPAIKVEQFTIRLIGDSSLICHKWSEKAKKEMLGKQRKVAKSAGREAKDPARDFIESLYWLDGEPEQKDEAGFNEAVRNGARFGFPSCAFKEAAASAGFRGKVFKDKVSTYGMFHIVGEFAEIKSDTPPQIREDMVRIGGKSPVADIRYRGEFVNWSTDIQINYVPDLISASQIVNIFNLAGFSVGVGEWRIEKGGDHGAFHVEAK